MTARRVSTGELAFAAEGIAGAAAASALRRVRCLADQAPTGRMFAAIATLADMSKRIETGLEAGDRASRGGDDIAATRELSRALAGLDRLATAAAPEPEALLPDYLLKRG